MAKIEIRELDSGDFQEWDKFVGSSQQSNIFSTSKWKGVIEESTPYKGHIFAFYRANEIVAGCLLFSIKKGPFNLIYQPPLTPFTTILFEKKSTDRLSKIESFEKDVVEELDKKLQNYAYSFLPMHPLIRDIRQFTFRNWQSRVNYTYLIEMSDAKSQWENIDKAAKYDIKKAGEKGVKVEISNNLDSFYKVYEKTFERQQIKKFPSKKLIENILRMDGSRLYVAKKADRVIAGAVVVLDTDTAYYLLAASNPEFREEKAPSLLLWKIIENCKAPLDLVGANTPAILKFKRDFAPKLVPYYSVKKYNSGLAKIFLSIKNV